MAKEIKTLIKDFEAAGFEVRLTKGNTHPKVYQGGHLVTTLPSSPSDHRSLKNARAALKRLSHSN
jgi:hypothetical protein